MNPTTKNQSLRLLRERDAADYLGVTDSTLQKWRYLGLGPRYIKIGGNHGRAVRYRLSDLTDYVSNNLVDTLDSNGVV